MSASFKAIYHLLCTSLAYVSNGFLTYLIWFKSPKDFGRYKYLMIFKSWFEAFYAAFDYFLRPIVYSTGYASFVARPVSGFSHSVSLLLIVIWCSLFGVTQAIFAVHFVYRYGAIHPEFYKKFLAGRKIFILFLIPVFAGIHWALAVHFSFMENEDNREYLRPTIFNMSGLQIEEMSYICAKFYVEDKKGHLLYDPIVWFGAINLYMIVLISMFCVFYLGIKCYRKIHSQLGQLENVLSNQTAHLQQQLFYALVAETLIPFVFIYLPYTILCGAAILNVDMGAMSSLVNYTITLYPAIDPIPTFVFIKNYREAVGKMFQSLFCKCSGNPENLTRSTSCQTTSIAITTV